MEMAFMLVDLINKATPGVAQLIMLIRKDDGTMAVIPLLNEADLNFSMRKAEDWLAAHPVKP